MPLAPSARLAHLQEAIGLGQAPQQRELDLVEDQGHTAVFPRGLRVDGWWKAMSHGGLNGKVVDA